MGGEDGLLSRKELQGTCQLLRWSLTQGHVPAQSLAWLGGTKSQTTRAICGPEHV